MKETQFCDLGLRDYREVWEMQEATLEKVKKQKLQGEETSNYLFFVEHLPVYTLGRSGKEANMLAGALQLKAKKAELIRVDRGGDITFHGPGQLVVYPVLDLENFGWGVKEYVKRLEEVVMRTLASYGIESGRVAGATGVWLEQGTSRERKICAIGVRCSRYITMHGFALNINTDLDYFNLIHPCGFVDKGVTSMQQELKREIEPEGVKQQVLKQFSVIFGMKFKK